MKVKFLKPIRETVEDYDKIEYEIGRIFREEIYIPLLLEMNVKILTVQNSTDDLLSAIQMGKIYFERGKFRGTFNAAISRELRRIGARWDRQQGCYSIPSSKLSIEIKQAISLSVSKFEQVMGRIDEKLSGYVPREFVENLKLQKIFESTIYKVDKNISKSMKGIAVAPELTREMRARVAAEYTENMQLYIQEWAEKEIIELRQNIKAKAAEGVRYESIIKEIKDSYGVSQRKAKFLARQETSLLMTKFKQVRYQDANVNEYKWTCVVGSPGHEVRPLHKKLDGTIHRWDNPPVVNDKGDRKNPGQDYGCRCYAIPMVRF